MKLHPTRPSSSSHAALPRRARRRAVEAPRPDPAEARVLQGGGLEDHAHYSCGCGFHFTARVATSVTCPHCGAGQAW